MFIPKTLNARFSTTHLYKHLKKILYEVKRLYLPIFTIYFFVFLIFIELCKTNNLTSVAKIFQLQARTQDHILNHYENFKLKKAKMTRELVQNRILWLKKLRQKLTINDKILRNGKNVDLISFSRISCMSLRIFLTMSMLVKSSF